MRSPFVSEGCKNSRCSPPLPSFPNKHKRTDRARYKFVATLPFLHPTPTTTRSLPPTFFSFNFIPNNPNTYNQHSFLSPTNYHSCDHILDHIFYTLSQDIFLIVKMRVSFVAALCVSAAHAALMGTTTAGTSSIAESTVYITDEVTITSCAATVTNCPADSTKVSKSKLTASSFQEIC